MAFREALLAIVEWGGLQQGAPPHRLRRNKSPARPPLHAGYARALEPRSSLHLAGGNPCAHVPRLVNQNREGYFLELSLVLTVWPNALTALFAHQFLEISACFRSHILSPRALARTEKFLA